MADLIDRNNALCARIRAEKAARAAGISQRPVNTGYRVGQRYSFDQLAAFQSRERVVYPEPAPTSAADLANWERDEQANRALPPEEQIDG